MLTSSKKVVNDIPQKKWSGFTTMVRIKFMTHFMAGVVIELEAERDQLRKVCDWLADFVPVEKDESGYNQLPHVKEEKHK